MIVTLDYVPGGKHLGEYEITHVFPNSYLLTPTDGVRSPIYIPRIDSMTIWDVEGFQIHESGESGNYLVYVIHYVKVSPIPENFPCKSLY